MKVTDAEIQKLVEELDRERQAWIEGRFDPKSAGHMVQARDMTIFGPFGGEAGSGGPELETRQRRMSSMFRGGSGMADVNHLSPPATIGLPHCHWFVGRCASSLSLLPDASRAVGGARREPVGRPECSPYGGARRGRAHSGASAAAECASPVPRRLALASSSRMLGPAISKMIA